MQVKVEVSDEIVQTANGANVQVCYIHLGGKYPERVTRYLGSEAALPAGQYLATKGRIENYRPVIDIRDLQRVNPK